MADTLKIVVRLGECRLCLEPDPVSGEACLSLVRMMIPLLIQVPMVDASVQLWREC